MELDLFLKRYARQNQFRHYIGVTYVAMERGGVPLNNQKYYADILRAVQLCVTIDDCDLRGRKTLWV